VAVTGRRVVLVLRALGLGDLLTSLPVLRALRASFASHSLWLAAPDWLAPLALHTGAVDRVVPVEPLGPVPVRRPALAVNLHGRGPESHRRLLETAPGALIAFGCPGVPETAGMPLWREGEHEVRRWCRLLAESGIPADPRALGLDPTGLPMRRAGRGATLLHPGAGAGARRWPPERWAVVARHETDRGRRVVITAARGEEGLAARVVAAARLPASAVASGDGLLQLAGTVAASARVASGDTGVAHLATALGRPSVVLFGPVSPAEWGPPPGPLHRALWAGRRGDPHAADPDPGLLEIQPDEVVAALEHLPRLEAGSCPDTRSGQELSCHRDYNVIAPRTCR
jgi:ADP-heptose:LPS heptosyltransferase